MLKLMKSRQFTPKFLLMQIPLWVLLVSFPSLAVPTPGRITPQDIRDDSHLFHELGNIDIQKEIKIDFESDVSKLDRLEGKYKEKLSGLTRYESHPRLRGPIDRISRLKYR